MGKRKYLLIILLFLCALSCIGAKNRDSIVLSVEYDGEVIIKEYEYQGERNFIEKLFGVNLIKKRDNLLKEGYCDQDVVRLMFPSLYIDIINFVDGTRRSPVDAKAEIIGDGKFRFYSEKLGYEIDSEKLFFDIARSIKNGRIIVSANRRILTPNYYKKDIQNNTKLMGEFSTNFQNSSDERRHNISLATSRLSGSEIKPNEEFSFNKVVGKRSEGRGYLGATVIENGKFVSGIGGGVCQVSTTLYNAILLSDVPVTSVMHHTLPVKYVPLSRDAMVSEYSDLKFYNNTGYSIFIFAEVLGDNLTIKLYGKKSKYDIFIDSKVVDEIPREVEYIDDKTLNFGEEKVIVEGADGVKSEAYLLKYLDGILVQKTTIRQDTYRSVKKVVARGRRS